MRNVPQQQESEFPPLAFAECVRAADWGHDYEKLYHAFTTAETSESTRAICTPLPKT
jgi:hypothetical protein